MRAGCDEARPGHAGDGREDDAVKDVYDFLQSYGLTKPGKAEFRLGKFSETKLYSRRSQMRILRRAEGPL